MERARKVRRVFGRGEGGAVGEWMADGRTDWGFAEERRGVGRARDVVG